MGANSFESLTYPLMHKLFVVRPDYASQLGKNYLKVRISTESTAQNHRSPFSLNHFIYTKRQLYKCNANIGDFYSANLLLFVEKQDFI